MMLNRAYKPLIAATLLTCTAFAQGKLSRIQYSSDASVTRVSITLTGTADAHYLSERLSDPDRIFFDFPGVRPQIEGSRNATIAATDPILQRIRVGETKPDVARVVLDLRGPAELSVETFSDPTRVLIELRQPKGSAIISQVRPQTRRLEAATVPVRESRQRALKAPPVPLITIAPPPLSLSLLAPPVNPLLPTKFPGAPAPARVQMAKAAVAPLVSVPQATASRSLPASRADKTVAFSSGLPAATPAASLTRALGLKIRRIVLDPGHGGYDQGTAGAAGLLEKDLVLEIARLLKKLLVDRMQAEVILTRSDDRFISLEDRTRTANESKADLFLSIHANSSPVKSVSGVETYVLSFTTSKEAMETAARENASSNRSVYELRDLLQKIALKEKVDESRRFAEKVNTELFRSWYNRTSTVRNRGVKQAPFVVLIGADMPSILAEVGFLSNVRDERELKKPETRQRIAESLYKGIEQYSNSLSHFQVASRTAGSDQE